MKISFLFLIFFVFSFSLFGQRPRKIYSYLSEKNVSEALKELNKYDTEKNYDSDDKILFEIAKSLLMIEKGLVIYNPIQSIQTFKNIIILSEDKEDIDIFLNKYQLDLNKISSLINTEIVFEAKRINSIEAYLNALKVCSINHKDELQILLERKTLDDAKEVKSILKLNNFITNNSNSSFKIEAIDFRDSLVLKNTPEIFDELKSYILKYPNSKFNIGIEKILPDLLYREVESSGYSLDLCERFISYYANDKRTYKMDSIIYFKAVQKDSIVGYRNYINLFKKGIYTSNANNKIENKILSLDKINNCFSLDTLINYAFCENILDFELEYIYRFKYLLIYDKFKLKINNSKIQDSQLSSFFIEKILDNEYVELIDGYQTDFEHSIFNSDYSSKILTVIKQKKEFEFLFNNLKKYNLGIDIEVNQINECIEVNKVFRNTCGVNMNQFLCVFVNNELKLIFDYTTKTEEKFKKIIFEKYKITPSMPFYNLYSNNNNYKLVFTYKNLNDYKIMSSSEVKFVGEIAFPFKLIDNNIIFDFNKIKLNKY